MHECQGHRNRFNLIHWKLIIMKCNPNDYDTEWIRKVN